VCNCPLRDEAVVIVLLDPTSDRGSCSSVINSLSLKVLDAVCLDGFEIRQKKGFCIVATSL
jgi:hypothetical protein